MGVIKNYLTKYSERIIVAVPLIAISIWIFVNYFYPNLYHTRFEDGVLVSGINWIPSVIFFSAVFGLIFLIIVKYFGIKSFVRNSRFPALVVLLPTLAVLSLILYHKYIFGNNLFLFYDIGSDTINVYYPAIYFFVNHFSDFPVFSFYHGLGNGYLTALIGNTLNLFNAAFLLLGTKNLAEGLVYINIIKIVFSGFFFYLFLRLLNKDLYTSIIFSILFAFNGFIMLWGQHYQFATYMVYFSLLLYSTELFVSQKRFGLLIVSLVFCSLSLYLFYQIMIIISIYFIFRLFYNGFSLTDSIKRILGYYGLVVLSFMLVFFIHLPAINSLINSPRINLSAEKLNVVSTFSDIQSIRFYITALGRFFANDLTGGAHNFFGWTENFNIYQGNYYESPQLYSGLLSLLLIPQVFNIENRRKRVACILLLIISLLFLTFPVFAKVFNGFQYPMYRWTYGIIVFNLVLAATIFSNFIEGKNLSNKILTASFLFYIGFLVILFLFVYLNFDKRLALFTLKQVLVVILILTFYFLVLLNSKNNNSIFKLLFFVAVCAEVVLIHYSSTNNRNTLEKNSIPYFDSTIPIVDYIKSTDSSSFYRVDKQYFSQRTNDAMVQDYYGIKAYSSMNPKSYVDFCQFFGLTDGKQIRHLPNREPTINRYSLLDLLSVKYLLTKNKLNVKYYDLVKSEDEIYLYKNTNHKPLGFTYNRYILSNQISEFSDNIKDIYAHSYLIVESRDENAFNDLINGHDRFHSNNQMLMDAVKANDFKRVKSLVEYEDLDIDFVGWDDGNSPLHWAVMNGNVDMANLLLQNGARCDLVNVYRMKPIDIAQSLQNVEIEELLASYQKVNSAKEFQITEFKPSHIKGTIETESNSVLFFSILYSNGWTVKVNGEETEFFKVNAGFIGVPLLKGTHAIELKYITPLFMKGLWISAFTFILLVLYLIAKKHSVLMRFVKKE
jgi:uncharacterized membrane protein YfhO